MLIFKTKFIYSLYSASAMGILMGLIYLKQYDWLDQLGTFVKD